MQLQRGGDAAFGRHGVALCQIDLGEREVGLEGGSIDGQQLLACLARRGQRALAAECEVEREGQQALLRVGEARIAPHCLQIRLEAAARVGHAHAHLVGRAHVASAQISKVRFHVARRPGEIRRLLPDGPGDLHRRLVERGEQLAAGPEDHVIERQLFLRRVHQQDTDAHAVGQLGAAVQHELGAFGQADVAGLLQRPRLRRHDPAMPPHALLAFQGAIRGELREIRVQTRRLREALGESPRQRAGVDPLGGIEHPPAAVEWHGEWKDHHLLGHAHPRARTSLVPGVGRGLCASAQKGAT